MAILEYPGGSPLSRVEVQVNAQGGTRAYLQAAAGSTPQQIAAMQSHFARLGWIGIPMLHKGQPVLELRGFKKPEELQEFLAKSGMVKGTPELTKDKEDPKGFAESIYDASLKFTGYSYLAADAAFYTYAGMELHDYYKKVAKVEANAAQKSAMEVAKLVQGAKESVKGGWYKILSGVGYNAGSFLLAHYGSRDQSHIEISNSIEKVERFIKTEGFADVNRETVLRKEPEKTDVSLLGRADQLLRRYPSEALNVVYTGVGLSLMRSSFKQIGSLGHEIQTAKQALDAAKAGSQSAEAITKLEHHLSGLKETKTTEIIDVGLGSITAGSALAGIFITEKKPLEGEHKRSGLAGVWDWIQEKPLRATGYGFMLATAFHAWATAKMWLPNQAEKSLLHEVGDMKLFGKLPTLADAEKMEVLEGFQRRRQNILGRGVFVALNVLAEVLMVISSKGHGEGVRNDDVDESVIASTAEFVAKQDPAKREALIERLAGYMSSKDVLGMKAETIANDLRTQVSAINSNPWAQSNPYVASAPVVAASEQAQVKVASPAPDQEAEKPPVTRIQTASVAHQAMVEGAAHQAIS